MLKFLVPILLFSGLLLNFHLPAQVFNPMVADIPMRDGKTLKADIHLPDTTGQFPVILIQTPYSRLLFRLGLPLGTGQNISSSPYAFVVVDWRCFYGSAAACVANTDRGQDGYDVVEWINIQSWSNGKIGMWGPSALGNIQYQTARENPPSLDCMVPVVASPQSTYLQIYPGGVAQIERIEQLDGLGFNVSGIYYANPVRNILWQIAESTTFYPEDIKIPALLIGGWFDHNTDAIMTMFDGLANLSDPEVRDQHRLLIGPWVHGGSGPAFVGSEQQGDLSFPKAKRKNDTLALAFFDYYLRDINNDWLNTPKIQYFQMGERVWKQETSWPPASKSYEFFFNSAYELSLQPPTENNSSTQFDYDPNDPSPTIGGSNINADLLQGPFDQSPEVESRNDLVIFTTPILTQAIAVHGSPKVKLSVASNRIDTDYAVRLTETFPDGKSILLLDGIQRMRFRDGFTPQDTSAIIPGQIYQIEIPLPNIAHTFLPGNQIKVMVSSSNYPRYNRNMNTGGPMYPDGKGDTLVNPLVATNTIYHNSLNSSSLDLPVALSTPIENEWSSSIQFEVFPNPVRDVFTIQWDSPIPVAIRLFRATGELILDTGYQRFAGNRYRIASDRMPTGMYLVELRTHRGDQGWQKLVVE